MAGIDIRGSFDVRAPYPSHYRTRAFIKDGSLITIQPIKPEDGPRLVEFFNSLSEASVFFRFLDKLKALPEEWVAYFTRIDYDQNVAMVAMKEIESRERILGVCRIMRKPGSARGEMAVVVGDPWQGKGIGAILLERSLGIARDLGIKAVWGIVARENGKMLDLARKFGFSTQLDQEADLYEIEMHLVGPDESESYTNSRK